MDTNLAWFDYVERLRPFLNAPLAERRFGPSVVNVYNFFAPPEPFGSARGVGGDWKARYDELNARCIEAEAVIDRLRQEIKEMQVRVPSTPASAPPLEKSLATRERESLLKLIIGMAVRGYGYVPSAARSTKCTDIEADLAELGIPLDVDTIRKWLRVAAQLLPSEKDDPHRPTPRPPSSAT